MKAVIERWYIAKDPQSILNWYLLRIINCTDADSLRRNMADLESELHRLKIQNPFRSGFAEDGFGVYNARGERVIFVECETDIEL